MTPVYFDTSVFLAVLAKEPEAAQVRGLLSELRADRIRIYTSILTVQEVSVSSFMNGGTFGDYHSKMARLARIQGVTKEIALTAAKLEARVIDLAKKTKGVSEADRITDNRRRKRRWRSAATSSTRSTESSPVEKPHSISGLRFWCQRRRVRDCRLPVGQARITSSKGRSPAPL
jgi:predicted nucleic acid-binding protein